MLRSPHSCRCSAYGSSCFGCTATTLKAFHNRMNVMVLKHVFRSSPVLLALIVPALLGSLAVVLCLDPLLKLFRAPLDEIDSTAWHVGQEQLASVSAR